MANSAQARKRYRQADKRRMHNASLKSEARTYMKRVLKAVDAKDKVLALKEYILAASKIDKLARVGIIHKNKAARHKSRLNSKVKSL